MTSRRGGQTVVESFFVILLLCLMFWGVLQAALLYNHERVLQFASFAAARSAAVGFKSDFCVRSYRAAAIPASGAMLSPQQNWTGLNQQDQQRRTELDLLPFYLWDDPRGNLNYVYWDKYNMQPNILATPTMITEQHDQPYPIEMPIISYLLYGQTNSTIRMMGNILSSVANHSYYYLNN